MLLNEDRDEALEEPALLSSSSITTWFGLHCILGRCGSIFGFCRGQELLSMLFIFLLIIW
jgi:hypothetical protein